MTKRWQLPKAKRQEIDEEERLLLVAQQDLMETIDKLEEQIKDSQDRLQRFVSRLMETRRNIIRLRKDYPKQ